MNTKPSAQRSFPATGSAHLRRSRSGASLVEVLIVLTIILIGVFIAIQIFPIGFTSLKRDEARLRADRLARNVTETLLSDQGALPEAISFSYYDAAGSLQTITDTDPDNLETYGNSDAEIAQNKLYFSDVNKFRYVQNEPVAVPLATATGDSGLGGGIGSVHFLSFGPVYMNAAVGDPTVAPTTPAQIALFDSYLKVTSEPLIRTVVDSDNGNNGASNANTSRNNSRFRNYLNSPNNYIIDYGDDGGAWIMFPPSVKTRIYTISYSYEVGRSTAGTDPDEVGVQSPVEITIPASPALVDGTTLGQYVWYKLAPGTFPNLSGPTADGDAIQPNTDIVVRNFARLPGDNPATAPVEGTAWDSTDPYQYKLVSANVAPSANLGVVAFNPVGANYSVSVPGGVKPFTALVSYAVLDWHILRDDREVPVGGVVRTTLPNIRPREDETTDLTETGANRTQVYPGLYPQGVTYNTVASLPPIAQSPDIQVFNLSDAGGTAKLLNSYDAADPGSTPGDYANFAADSALPPNQQPYFWINRSRAGGTYPTGGIYINTNRVPVGSKVRILYKAQGNWAVAFQKAAKAYRFQEATGGQLPVANNANVYAISRNGTPTDFTDDRVVFHRTELNKGVTATVEITTGSGNTRRITRLPVRQFSIQNADGQYAFANLSDIATELRTGTYNGDSITGTRIVGNIAGASLKTRVVWQDDPNGRNKFRVSDLETFVSRQAQ